MSESNLYKQLKNNWKNKFIKRYETFGVGSGLPDCHLVNQNQVDIFVELKFLKNKFRKKKLPIRSFQIIWFLDYRGRNAYFLFKVDDSYFVFNKNSALILKDQISYLDFVSASILATKDFKAIINFFENIS